MALSQIWALYLPRIFGSFGRLKKAGQKPVVIIVYVEFQKDISKRKLILKSFSCLKKSICAHAIALIALLTTISKNVFFSDSIFIVRPVLIFNPETTVKVN